VNFQGIFFTVQQAVPLMANGGSTVPTTPFLSAVGASGLLILSATEWGSKHRFPLHRFGEPVEVARAALFLCHAASRIGLAEAPRLRCRHTFGVSPTTRENTVVKCAWVLKPTSKAISTNGR
jgi:hypothetical protein